MPNGVAARKDVRVATAYLGHCGADDVVVTTKNRVRIAWRESGKRLASALAASPTNIDASASVARQLIRRRYREIGVEVGA